MLLGFNNVSVYNSSRVVKISLIIIYGRQLDLVFSYWFQFEFVLTSVHALLENALAGRVTYVHCKAGRGRSTTVVICYLVGVSPLQG